ncbi:MAG: cysteine--tRNA ligase [Candidatus Poribacteria bacterium]|nr:cysteine--tRNA ligase [Candidatus Poribacteria bacterium]
MSLRLYNSLHRRVEPFEPMKPGKVTMYCCGPTVYDYIGIHNARTLVTFDVIRRYLEYRGYDVTFVQNITDIDDKIIQRANENGADSAAWAQRYADEYLADMDRLRVRPANIVPRATDSLDEIQGLIERLIATDAAYETESGVYYSVPAFAEYGKLSNRTADDIQSGARVDVDEEKRDPRDFAVWKRAKIGEPWWESPWGNGRPGWHIECSAMIKKHLGDTIDIHAGGADLMFPHHENEIAQSELANEKPLARYWLHGGLMRIDGERMGKSMGNFVRVHDAVDKYAIEAIRLFLLSTHYRKPLDFTDGAIPEQVAPTRRLNRCLDALAAAAGDAQPSAVSEPNAVAFVERVEAAKTQFSEIVDDDFNFPGGFGVLFEFVTEANRFLAEHPTPSADERAAIAAAYTFLNEVSTDVFGFRSDSSGTNVARLAPVIELALSAREDARAAKDWATADAIRDRMIETGVELKDSRDATGWELRDESSPEIVAEALIGLLIDLRADARSAKNFARADAVRDGLAKIGVMLKDSSDGTGWEWGDPSE